VTNRPRYVVDTSVYVTSLMSSRGASRALVDAWRRGDCEVVVSPKLLRELEQTVQRRPYVRERVDPAEARRLVGELRTRGELQRDPKVSQQLTRDPNDDYVEALRQQAGARGVSHDKDLLVLRTRDGDRPYVRPDEALEQLRQRARLQQQPTLDRRRSHRDER
jgi:putative PIN family toxin of toxin-antitoxin system